MFRNLAIVLITAAVVALPFLLRPAEEASAWRPGDPTIVIVTPHNEAVRTEFARGFSAWHHERFGKPVRIDWRAIGGTSEIMRYLVAEYTAAFRTWWKSEGHPWSADAARAIVDRKFKPDHPPAGAGDDPGAMAKWNRVRDAHLAFRETDDAANFTAKIDIFFGGGTYDHGKAFRQGLSVPPWPDDASPPDTLRTAEGAVLIPAGLSGETWRDRAMFGNAVSTFGIVYNFDRLHDLGIENPPRTWRDLTSPAYIRQIGVADPTKSGSIAKAFEMIIHQQCYNAVRDAGYSDRQIDAWESAINDARLDPGVLPHGVPAEYQDAMETGWREGLRVVQLIGANARYFTDSASKVPIDVSTGDAAAGLAIDFYGRYQAECSLSPDGEARMTYVTPAGGSSVSADPISLLRGAENRELAVRFIEFVLSEDGQRLWTYRPGTPGGPHRFALRRLPIRRDFYPSDDATFAARAAEHAEHAADPLDDPAVNPYRLAEDFTYRHRWTARHFGVHRDLIRAMCLDAADELKEAWQAIVAHGGPQAQPEAMALLQRLPDVPEPLAWRSALAIPRAHDRLDYMRDWTGFFRASYREARRAVKPGAET